MNATRQTDEMIIAVAISITSVCYQVVDEIPSLEQDSYHNDRYGDTC